MQMHFCCRASRKEDSVRLLSEIRRCGLSKEKFRIVVKKLVTFLHRQCQLLEHSVQNKGKCFTDNGFLSHDGDKSNASDLLSLTEVGSILRTSSALVGAFCRTASRLVLSCEESACAPLCYGEECGNSSSTSTKTTVTGGSLSAPLHCSDTTPFVDSFFPTVFAGDSFSVSDKEGKWRDFYGGQMRTCDDEKQGNGNVDGGKESVRPPENSSGCCCCCCSVGKGSSKSSCYTVGELIHWLSSAHTFSFLLHRRVYLNKHDVFILAYLLHRLAWLAMLLPFSEAQEAFEVPNRPNSLFNMSNSRKFSTIAAAAAPSFKDVETSSTVQEKKNDISKDGRQDGKNAFVCPSKELHRKDAFQSSSGAPFSLSLPHKSYSSMHPLFSAGCSSTCFSLLSALAYGLGELLQYDLLLYRHAKNELSTLLTPVADGSQWNVSEIVMSLMDLSFLFFEKENELTTTTHWCDYSSWLYEPPLSIFFFKVFASHFSSPSYHNENELSPSTPSLQPSSRYHYSSLSSPTETSVVCRCPLHCPFTLTLVRYPARGRMCRHLQFFDAYNFVLAVLQSFSSSSTRGNNSSTAAYLLSEDAVRQNDPLVSSAENGDGTNTSTSNFIPTASNPSSPLCAGGPCPICHNYVRIDDLRIDIRVLRAMTDVQPLSTDNAPESLGNEKTEDSGTSLPSVFAPLSPSTHILEWVVDSLHHAPTAVESEDDLNEKEDEQDNTSSTKINESVAKEDKPSFASLPSTHWSCVPPLHQSSSSSSMSDSLIQNDDAENEFLRKCRCYVVKQSSVGIFPNENKITKNDVSVGGGAETSSFLSSSPTFSPSSSSLLPQNKVDTTMSTGVPIEIVSETKDTSSQSSPLPPLKRRRVDIAGHVLYVDE